MSKPVPLEKITFCANSRKMASSTESNLQLTRYEATCWVTKNW